MQPKLRSMRSSDRSVSAWVITLVISMGIVLVLPEPELSRGLASYLPLHTTLEIIAIAVACMVFGIAWVTQKFQPSSKVIILGTGALSVLLLDITHTISYQGMPSFITPSGPEKAINFWLAARLMMALTLFFVACITTRIEKKLTMVSRYFWLASAIVIVASFHIWFLYYPQSVPTTFIKGEGLTRFKVITEYVLIGIYLFSGFLLIKQLSHVREFGVNWLVAAAVTMAMSEFFFTLYANVSDMYNLIGHVYKVIGFIFLYRALFVETVQSPFLNMLQLQAKLSATIDTLPDILVEVDAKGNHVEIHSSDPKLLIDKPENLVGKNIKQVMSKEAARTCFEAMAVADKIGISRGARINLKTPSGERTFELSIARKVSQEGKPPTFLILSRDISSTIEIEQQIAHEAKLNKHLLELQNYLHVGGEKHFMQHSVDTAENLTDSSIAFIHFIDETQK